MNVAEAMDKFLEASDEMTKHQRLALRAFVGGYGDTSVINITKDDLRHFLRESFINNSIPSEACVDSLKMFFHWLQSQGLIETNPAERLVDLKRPVLKSHPDKHD